MILPISTSDQCIASPRAQVKAAEEAWNSKDVERVAAAYTEDSEWRNRAEFVRGREAIKDVRTKGGWGELRVQ